MLHNNFPFVVEPEAGCQCVPEGPVALTDCLQDGDALLTRTRLSEASP
jgi:hypothetical protein